MILSPVWSGVLMVGGGMALGAALAGVAARVLVKRSLGKVRAAERRARSAERLAEVGGMTSGLAHEIKNPLSTIGLNAQLLMEGVEELEIPEEERGRLSRRLSALTREVDRLRGILTDFLEYAGEMRLDRRGADMNVVVGELADFFMPQAEKAGVRLRTDCGAGEIRAVVDVPAVKQALLNLMLNAVQAMQGMPGGGARELIVKTQRGQDGDGARTVVVHVIDTGPGIPPENRERIFSPYFTTKSGGTGLGLATTRRIIEAHGGRIDVFSEVGRGTDFVVTLAEEGAPGGTP